MITAGVGGIHRWRLNTPFHRELINAEGNLEYVTLTGFALNVDERSGLGYESAWIFESNLLYASSSGGLPRISRTAPFNGAIGGEGELFYSIVDTATTTQQDRNPGNNSENYPACEF